MAKRSGNINLDITSILLALLENLARIDLELKERILNSNQNKKVCFLPTAAKIKHVFAGECVEFTGSTEKIQELEIYSPLGC